MRRKRSIPIALGIVCGLLAITALAEHEVDHRYEVMGYVLDVDEKPVVGSPVVILMNNSVIGRDETDSDGFYTVRMHLHDADLGKELQVRTSAGEGTIRVTFARGDARTRRIHHANIVGGRLVEENLAKRSIPLWIYGVIAGLLVVLAGRFIGARVKRKRQRKKSSQRSQEKRSQKRKRRRRR